jgi:Family of unknown function (DUF6600)/FecR protein
MSINSRLQASFKALVLAVPLALLAFLWQAPRQTLAQGDSQQRVIRLSFVEGTVGVLPADTSEWAQASINTPIEEGYELATQKNSFAEVQFEDASTLRLGELSDVRFDRLRASDSGRPLTRIDFESGYGTVHVISDTSAGFELKAGESTLTPEGESEFRIDRNDQALRIEVWSGIIDFSGPLGNIELDQNQVLTYTPGSGEPYDVESGLTQDDWDRWVAARDQAQVSGQGSVNPVNYGGVRSSNLYGWSDLSSYGAWIYFTSVGYAWCPYVSYNWAPYSFGRWIWYPGFGYTWVSFEPWGWLPYHYGQWAYEPGRRWAWVPSSFANWSPALVNWYQGPGWIGWTPQGTETLPGTGRPCSRAGAGCFRAVSVKTFQAGLAVTPQAILQIDSQQGRQVSKPDLPVTRLAMLPGAPMARASRGPANSVRYGAAGASSSLSSGGMPPRPAAAGTLAAPSNSRSRTGEEPSPPQGRSGRSGPAGAEGRTFPSSHPHFTGAPAPRSSPRTGPEHGEGFGARPVPYGGGPRERSSSPPASAGFPGARSGVAH